MSKAEFTSHIHRHAATLSETFGNAIAHLIPPNEQTMTQSKPYGPFPGTGDDDPKSPVAQAFLGAFDQALKFKRSSVLSGKKYKLVFFAPGDRFNPDTMTRKGDGWSAFVPERVRRMKKPKGWPKDLVIATESTIKLCIFPGLYSKPDRELRQDGVGVAVNSCLIDCDNFVRDESDGFTLVAKAVVLV